MAWAVGLAVAALAGARPGAAQDLFVPGTGLEGAGSSPASPVGYARGRPHIIFLLSDDLGWNNVGFHNPQVQTPAIDALRREGVEFTRHYAYKFCSPSRSSFLSGRLPVHVNERNKITEAPLAGVHPNMTMIPAMLKQAGYATHQIGKWHAGFATWHHIPVARGFDTSFGFFHGMEDHYKHTCKGNTCHRQITDLWRDRGPATGFDGVYSMALWRQRAREILKEHDPSVRLFLYLAFANNHSPLQVPKRYRDKYNSVDATRRWRTFQGMMTAVDDLVGEIVEILRAKGMWEDSLVIWTSDNGGSYCKAGNNYPLRGSKISNWEGAFRVPTVVSGGIIPPVRHGTSYAGITHFADWYSTFASLAGVPPVDARAMAAGLPPVDGYDLSDAILRGGMSPWAGKPLLLSSYAADPVINPHHSAVLLLDDYKLLVGLSECSMWSGPMTPNASTPRGLACWLGHRVQCGTGCLYNVVKDPGEHVDLAQSEPQKLHELQMLLHREHQSVYDPDRGDPGDIPCKAAEAAGGFWTPYLPSGDQPGLTPTLPGLDSENE